MSNVSRLEIEARLFVFTILGEMKQEGQLTDATADQQRLLVDLLRMFPLERWHEQCLITEEQLVEWIAQALILLAPSESDPRT